MGRKTKTEFPKDKSITFKLVSADEPEGTPPNAFVSDARVWVPVEVGKKRAGKNDDILSVYSGVDEAGSVFGGGIGAGASVYSYRTSTSSRMKAPAREEGEGDEAVEMLGDDDAPAIPNDGYTGGLYFEDEEPDPELFGDDVEHDALEDDFVLLANRPLEGEEDDEMVDRLRDFDDEEVHMFEDEGEDFGMSLEEQEKLHAQWAEEDQRAQAERFQRIKQQFQSETGEDERKAATMRFLDEQFEHVMKLYDHDEIGELDEGDPEIQGTQMIEEFEDVLDEFLESQKPHKFGDERSLKQHDDNNNDNDNDNDNSRRHECDDEDEYDDEDDELRSIRSIPNDIPVPQGMRILKRNERKKAKADEVSIDEIKKIVKERYLNEDYNNEPEEQEFVELEPEREQWDCETIVSTYSNLENHPTLIREDPLGKKKKKKKPPQQIKLSTKTGMPINVLKKKQQESDDDDDDDESCEDEQSRENLGAARPKNETAEEKRQRKKAIKEERKNKRQQKKQLKTDFKQEEIKQTAILRQQRAQQATVVKY